MYSDVLTCNVGILSSLMASHHIWGPSSYYSALDRCM